MQEPPTSIAASTGKPGRAKTGYKFLLLVALLAVVASWPFCPWFGGLKPATPTRASSVTVPVTSHIDDRLSALEAHMGDLNAKLDRITDALAKTADNVASAATSPALDSMKQDISALQAQVKASADAAQSQAAAQKALAGTRTPAQLADEFATLETPVYQAIQKINAQTLADRLMVEMQSIVSIRRVDDDGAGSKLAAIEQKLRADDIAAALDIAKELPPVAEPILGEWKAKADARLAAEQALRGDKADTAVKP